MAYTIRVHPDKRVAYFKFWDEMSTESAKEAFLEYTRDPHFDPTYLMVTDARAVSKIHATFRGILFGAESLRSLLVKFERGTLSAILVNDSTQFGYARMLEQVLALFSRITVQIAYDERELWRIAGRVDLDLAQLAEK